MRRVIKWFVILAVPLGILGFIGVQAAAFVKAKATPRFTTSEITKGKIETVVNSTGPVKPVRSVTVGSFISGPIQEIRVDFNAKVIANELLARIDPRLQQAALDREKASLATQKADLARVEAQLQQAKNNEDRAIKLRASNKEFVSDQEMDQLHFTRKSLEAQKDLSLANISQAEASVKNAETNMGYTEIRSPVNGIVIERKVDPGQTVASAFQTPEMFIIAPDMEKHMHVFASVDEADIGHIRKAQDQNRPVTFVVDAYPDDVFTGKIYQIRKNGTTTQNVVTYPVVIEAPNQELKLLPGMTANISFQIDVREDVLRVPTSAMRFVPPANLVRPEDRGLLEPVKSPKEGEQKLSAGQRAAQAKTRNKRTVWVQEGEFLKAVPVTLGLSDGQFSELLEGELTQGQKIVTGTEGGIRESR